MIGPRRPLPAPPPADSAAVRVARLLLLLALFGLLAFGARVPLADALDSLLRAPRAAL